MPEGAVKESGQDGVEEGSGEGGDVRGKCRPPEDGLPEDLRGRHVHDQGKWRDDGEENPEGQREGVDRVLAGTAAAVGERIGNLHGFDAVNAKYRLDEEEAEHEPEAAENALQKEENVRESPVDLGEMAPEDEAHHADGDAGDPPGIDRAANDLREDAARAEEERVELAGLHHRAKISGKTPAEELREVEAHGHKAEEEEKVPREPFAKTAEAVDEKDDRQKLRPLHNKLPKGLQAEGQGILEVAF